ncbi:MAG: hypothetical protein JWO87_1825 [Phycisphaerales bacterium]|nr:hypothetical protein [Phycisphaerales bacterium]MDB5302938.1 hypothetical protein [Phycisphaerales bacterium]
MAELLVVVCFLSMADLFFTLWAQIFTQFHELNPLARNMLNHNAILGLVVMKVSLTALGAAIFWHLRRFGRAEIALWAVVFVYVGLAFRWSTYTIEIATLTAH